MAWAMAASMVWMACSGGTEPTNIDPPDPTETDTTDTDTGTPPVPASPDLVFSNLNNYSFRGTWTFPSVTVRPQFDTILDWGDLTADAYGNKRLASSYDRVVLLQASGDIDDFTDTLRDDLLNNTTALLGAWQQDVGGTVTRLNQLLDASKQPFESENFLLVSGSITYFVGLCDVVGESCDIRAGIVLVPDDKSNESRAEFPDGSSSFVVDQIAFDGEPVVTSGVHDLYTADWRPVTTNVHGEDMDRFTANELFIAHWADGRDPATLTPDIFDLAANADGYWTADVLQDRELRLEFARDADGANFGGFTSGGTWMLGVGCDNCWGNVPWFLSVIEVE